MPPCRKGQLGSWVVEDKHTMEFLWKDLHFSFKLRKGASVQSSLRCMVNCLQWLLCVALCFSRLIKCLTNTCSTWSQQRMSFSLLLPLFFKEGFLICAFGFDAFNIIYVYLTNFKNKFNLPIRENLHSNCMCCSCFISCWKKNHPPICLPFI